MTKDAELVGEIEGPPEGDRRLQDRDAQWRGHLTERVGALDRLLRQQAAGLVSLRDTAHAAVAAGGRDVFTEVPRSLADGLRGLGLDLENTLHERMEAILDALSGEFGVGGVRMTPAQLTLLDLAAPADRPAVPDAPIVVAPPEPGPIQPLPWQLPSADQPHALTDGERRSGGVLDKVPEQGSCAGLRDRQGDRQGRRFGALPRSGQIGVLLGASAAVIGGLLSALRFLRGRQRRDLQLHIDQTIAQYRTTLPPALQAALRQVHADLERSATARLADHQLRLDQELADAEANQAAAPGITGPPPCPGARADTGGHHGARGGKRLLQAAA